MTDLSNLTVRETQDSGRTIYQTITATVIRRSDYNTNQYAIAGIDGFWERKMDLPQPEINGLYRMILASKPKGSNAKAGALYLDILQMERSDGDPTELAPRQPAAASGAGSDGERPQQRTEAYDARGNFWTAKDRIILEQNLTNRDTDILQAIASVAANDNGAAELFLETLEAARASVARLRALTESMPEIFVSEVEEDPQHAPPTADEPAHGDPADEDERPW